MFNLELGIWKIWGIPQILNILGNSPNTRESGEFPNYLEIWEIFQIPGDLGNFLNSLENRRVVLFLK